MKWLLTILIILLLILQWRLWFGDFSLPAAWRLSEQVTEQKAENAKLNERNEQLEAEVSDLKQGLSAIEERARSQLGMIKPNETFYQVVDLPPEKGTPGKLPPEEAEQTSEPDTEAENHDE